jgi:hypothetical protein
VKKLTIDPAIILIKIKLDDFSIDAQHPHHPISHKGPYTPIERETAKSAETTLICTEMNNLPKKNIVFWVMLFVSEKTTL